MGGVSDKEEEQRILLMLNH